jgi:hypothetical protein
MENQSRGNHGNKNKPAGGFCLVSGTALLSAWAAYRRAEIRLLDLRVWFACSELLARRCGLIEGRLPRYSLAEIHGLVGGVGGEHLRHAIARLERARLLSWSESAIVFPGGQTLAGRPGLGAILDLVPNHRRLVPVPRRIVRLIAGGARRVVIATILGHLLRCLYYRGGQCLPEGTCKASWIAELFGVNVRNVKAARKHLVGMGWLVPVSTRQTCLNRFGQRVRVNLEWSRNDISAKPKRSPPRPLSTTGSPPPYKDKKLSSRIYMNQKPGNGAPGVSEKRGRGAEPTLHHVVAEDLADVGRLSALHRQAIEAGLISQSECDRLRLFAAAEHAKAIGTKNPCGLFATIVRRRLWAFITQDDEDAAVRTLKRSESGSLVRAHAPEIVENERPPRGKSTLALSRAEIRAMIAASLDESGTGEAFSGRSAAVPAGRPCAG